MHCKLCDLQNGMSDLSALPIPSRGKEWNSLPVSCAWSPKIVLGGFTSASLQHQEQHVFIIKDHQARNTRSPPTWQGGNWRSRMLGQPGSKVHPGRALSWPIGIVNEGYKGRNTLCSPWLQLPTSVTCYFSQVVKPIQRRLPGDRGDNPPLCREGGRGEEVPTADSEPQRHLKPRN